MRNMALALALICVSTAALSAPPFASPLNVTVDNPVLPVEVQNADPIPVSITSEPAQTTYAYTSTPNCPFLNQCSATYPTVPAGKRLHVTFVAGFVQTNAAVDGIAALHHDNSSGSTVRYITRVAGAQLAYYGAALSFGEQIDLVFEPGEAPVLEVGTTGTISDTVFNKLTITGYLVNAAP